jgi:hypothetical protein
MKKNVILIFMLVLLFVLTSFSHVYSAQGKLRVAVVRFENNSTWHWWGDRLGEAAADVFVTKLLWERPPRMCLLPNSWRPENSL